ncbi:19272_t:CDS:2, partial [Gigaspora rosea]
SNWEIPVPNAIHLNPAHFNRQNLEKEPILKGIETNEKENKTILVSDLEIRQGKNKDARL